MTTHQPTSEELAARVMALAQAQAAVATRIADFAKRADTIECT